MSDVCVKVRGRKNMIVKGDSEMVTAVEMKPISEIITCIRIVSGARREECRKS